MKVENIADQLQIWSILLQYLILTPKFWRVPKEKYGITNFFSRIQHYYTYFQTPCKNCGNIATWKVSGKQRK